MEEAKKRKTTDLDDSYFKAYADISIHEEMIADKVRTVNYRLAILKNYKAIRGKVVADIGAGTGILSMFCIQAGAKKVYAIEASSLAKQTEEVIIANNMKDKIQVINKKVEEVELPEQVDVIVSEWMGYCLLYENMLPSVLYARDKWLRQGGVMLPSTADLYLAPVTDEEYYNEKLNFWNSIEDTYDINMSCLRPFAQQCLTSRVHVNSIDPESVMSHASRVCHLDLSTITVKELHQIQGEFQFNCFGRSCVHGLCLWFDVHFPEGVTLTTSPYFRETHWMQTLVYLEDPVQVEQDTIISGTITLCPTPHKERYLDISVKYKVNEREYKYKTYNMNDCIT